MIQTTSRSQYVTSQACPRQGFLGYHLISAPDSSPGLQSLRVSIPLLTGGKIHEGLALLMQGRSLEEAVSSSRASFLSFLEGRDLLIDPKGEGNKQITFSNEVIEYMTGQELALVESLLRVFHLRGLPSLSHYYEVLEVEKEGPPITLGYLSNDAPLVFQWRPDGLLKRKTDGELVILSFKTAATYGQLQELQFSRDDQGISEVWALEQAMAYWHQAPASAPKWYASHFSSDPTPPRVAGVQMCVLLKGRKRSDSSTPGKEVRYSPLIQGYCQSSPQGLGMDALYAWSWDVPKISKEGNSYTGNIGSKWKRFPVWTDYPEGIEGWISLLASGMIQPECGDPLASQMVFPEFAPKRDDRVESWARQLSLHELTRAEMATEANRLFQERDWETLSHYLDEHYPQRLGNCVHYGGLCTFDPICQGPPQIITNPLGTGTYSARTPHHVLEDENQE